MVYNIFFPQLRESVNPSSFDFWFDSNLLQRQIKNNIKLQSYCLIKNVLFRFNNISMFNSNELN